MRDHNGQRVDEYGAPIYSSREKAQMEREQKRQEKEYKRSPEYKKLKKDYGY